jgi:hypothetical protein
MPSVARILALEHPLYSKAELIEHRRNTSRYARSFPLGSERNRHRQICLVASRLAQEVEMAWRIHPMRFHLLRMHLPTQGRNISGTISCWGRSPIADVSSA